MDNSAEGDYEFFIRARNFINESSRRDPSRAKRLSQVARAFLQRYQQSSLAGSTVVDSRRELYLHWAIRYGREAAEGTPSDNPDRGYRFDNASITHSMRYELKGTTEDLDDAIALGRIAVDSTEPGDPDRASYLSNLSLSLCNRSKLPGRPPGENNGDLREAVQFARQATKDEAIQDLERLNYLNALANILGERFQRLPDIADLSEGIASLQAAIRIVKPDPRLPGLFTTSANLLRSRYNSPDGGGVVDLEAAVTMRRKALALAPDNISGAHQATLISNLCLSLDDLFQAKGEREDLEEAIRYGRMAVKLTSEGAFERVDKLNNLGSALHSHFDRFGSTDSLMESIQFGRQAVAAATRTCHPNKGIYLNNLGRRLCSLYSQGGHDQDLEEAIQYVHESVNTAPLSHVKVAYLKTLSEMFEMRFETLGAIADLDNAMQVANEIITPMSPSHPALPDALELVASILLYKYQRTKQEPLLKQAICKQHRANEKTADSHPSKANRLHNLSRLISFKDGLGGPKDLEDAIHYELQVVELDDAEHRKRASVLHSLSLLYGLQYDSNTLTEGGLETLLEEALSKAEAAVTETPEGHPSRAGRLESLGMLLTYKFAQKKSLEVLQQAILKYTDSLEQVNSYLSFGSILVNSRFSK